MAVIPAVAALSVLGTWLDAKYSLISDIEQIRCMKRQQLYWQYLCKIHGDSDWSYYHTIHCTYGKNEYDEAFLFEDRSWTYSQFRGEIGRLAQVFQKLGIGNRTVVGMYINNSPEFMFAWWALYKIGAIPAPVNTSITNEPFRHCFKVSSSEYLICSYELFDAANGSLTGHDVGPLKKIILYDYDSKFTLEVLSRLSFSPQAEHQFRFFAGYDHGALQGYVVSIILGILVHVLDS